MQILAELKLEAVLDNLRTFMAFVADTAKKQGIDGKKVSEMELALEEAFVNICSYAYREGPGEAHVVCYLEDNGKFVIELTDSGEAFNILEHQDSDITAGLLDRKVGGLGIMFMKNLMDDVRYRREDGKNILSLVVNL